MVSTSLAGLGKTFILDTFSVSSVPIHPALHKVSMHPLLSNLMISPSVLLVI